MRKSTSAVMVALVGAGAAVLVAAPAAATVGCNQVVTPGAPHGFTFQNTAFDADSANVAGGSTTQGYIDKALAAEVPLTANQAAYSIKTDDGKDVYKQGFAYYLGIDQDGNSGTTDSIDNLFYEPQSYGAGIWHSGAPNGSGGYLFQGTLSDFLAANPNATITEFAGNYGPGVPDGLEPVQTLTFQGCTYTFAAHNRAPTASFTVNNAGDTNYRTFGFDARRSSDPEHQTLSYSWKFGDGTTGHGAVVTHTYPVARGKTYYATLTVSDGVNRTSTTRKVLVS